MSTPVPGNADGGSPVYPTPFTAVLLAMLAWFLSPLVATLFFPLTTQMAALGIGITVGAGGVATWAARRVPPPQAERLGLRGPGPRHLLAVLLLVPTVVLASELHNAVQQLWPPADAPQIAERVRERIGTAADPLAITESLIVTAGLAPIAEEWLFRGVIQQGLVANLGAVRGVALTALLFALAHGAPGISLAAWLGVASSTFLIGLALGVARLCSGSLLAAILLHAGMNAFSTVVVGWAERFPIPGLNAPGAHTPAIWLVGSGFSVALGLALIATDRSRGRPGPTPPLPADGA